MPVRGVDAPVYGVGLPPDAPRPLFVWTVSLPLGWRVIDLDPRCTDASIANILRDDDVVPGVRLKSAQKRQLKEALASMAAEARKAGAVWVLVLPGVQEDYVSAVTLLLRWSDSAPRSASVLEIQRQLGADVTSVEPTLNGESYVLHSSSSLAGPVTDRRTVYTHQAFVPVPSTTWTLAVSATAPDADTGEDVKAIVGRVAASVVAWPEITEQLREVEQLPVGNVVDETAAPVDAESSRVWVDSQGSVDVDV